MTEGTREQGRGVNGAGPHASPPAVALRGRWLLLARVAWVVLAAATLGVFAISVLDRYSRLSHPSASVRAALEEVGLSTNGYALYNVGLDVAFVSVFAAVALVIFWRRSDDRMALLVATMLVLWGTLNELFVQTPVRIGGPYPVVDAALNLLTYAGYMAWMLFFYLFPSGRFVPRWTRWMALCWVLFSGSWIFTPEYGPPGWPPLLFNAAIVLLWGSFLVAQVYRYTRVSDAIQRQQSRWVVFGVAVAVTGALTTIFLVGAAVDLRPEEVVRRMLSMLLMDAFMLLVPLSIGAAVLRSRLFDIDVVINRTLVYGPLTATLVLTYLGAVVLLQGILRALTGGESQVAVVASTLVIAALFEPLRRRIQALIDRRFYRKKYDTRKTLETFSARLRRETNLEVLNEDIVGVVKETMQPAHASLWLRPDTGFKEDRPEADASS